MVLQITLFLLFLMCFKVETQKHINIYTFLLPGAFVPLTSEGNIIVDEVLASCYASSDHDLAHMAMIPMKWFTYVMKLVFGQELNFSSYVMIAEEIGRWVSPYGDIMYN